MKVILSTIFLLYTSLVFCQNTVGILKNTPQSTNGYTLFSPLSNQVTYLIDNCGRQVHSWRSRFGSGLSAYLQPDGTLIKATQSNLTGTFPSLGGIGGRIERLAWDGTIEWQYHHINTRVSVGKRKYIQHHDFEVLPNGNILILAWEEYSKAEMIAAGLDPNAIFIDRPTLVEYVVEIEPQGTNQAKIVWEWHLFDHLIQDLDSTKANYGVVADHPEKIDINFTSRIQNSDWVHANSIDYNEELDQILISARELDEIWIIDHSTTTAEAKGDTGGRRGKGGDLLYRWGNPSIYDRAARADKQFFKQHDARWIEKGLPDAGKIMVYNNGEISTTPRAYSSVEIIDPEVDANGNYPVPASAPFLPTSATKVYKLDLRNHTRTNLSRIVSGAQRLPNGNTLICSGGNIGVIQEFDTNDSLVWEYVNPILSGTNEQRICQGDDPEFKIRSIFRATRYLPDYSAFDNKNLTTGNELECNPGPLSCQIYTKPNNTSINTSTLGIKGFKAYPNPVVNNVLNLEFESSFKADKHRFEIVNALGKSILNKGIESTSVTINTEELELGIYVLQILNNEQSIVLRRKIIITSIH